MRLIDPIELKRSIVVSNIIGDGKTLEELIDEQPDAQLAQDLHSACTDSISRQAAIDELKKYIAVNRNPDHDARIWEEGMNCAVTVIGALPAAQPQWIPVAERLPERCNYYIVTDFDKVDEAYYNSDGRWFSWDGNKLKDVTAWMPLPEPYKEGQE